MRGRSQPFRWRRRNATNGANGPTARADSKLFWGHAIATASRPPAFFVRRSFLSALMTQKSAKHPIVAAKPAAQNLDRGARRHRPGKPLCRSSPGRRPVLISGAAEPKFTLQSCPSRRLVEQPREACRVGWKASLDPTLLQLFQRLADGPSLGDSARDKIGARERQARFLGVLQKFSRALPFVIVPRASIGLRQYYCVARRLAAVAEEQAPQSIWLWRLAKPMQPSQRQRGAFETLPLRVVKPQRLPPRA